MGEQLVFVPCRLDRRDARSARIDDADGWPRRVTSPLGRVAGRLVVAARWVRAAAGRHRVRFGDGSEWWVVQGPGRPEDFIPLGWGPVARPGLVPSDRPAADGMEASPTLADAGRPAVGPCTGGPGRG
jgi:hypothetical protein